MEFQRKQFDTVLSRIEEPRGKIQVIIGPRQVGKSTLMDQSAGEDNYTVHAGEGRQSQ